MEKIISIIVIGSILFIFTLLIVFGIQNASYGPKVGTVIDKKYTSESSYYTYDTVYSGNTSITVPKYHHYPATWKLKLQKTEDGKTKEIWIEVTEDEYNKIKIGEFYGE